MGYDNGVSDPGVPSIRELASLYRSPESNPGAVLTFKIKRFQTPRVGNRGDSDTKGANESGDFDKRNFQMSESPGSFCSGAPW